MLLAYAKEAFNLCKTAMPSIVLYSLSKENLSEICQVLTERYVQGHTIPGTRSYHVFPKKQLVASSLKLKQRMIGMLVATSFLIVSTEI